MNGIIGNLTKALLLLMVVVCLNATANPILLCDTSQSVNFLLKQPNHPKASTLQTAITAFKCANKKGIITNKNVLTIIDYDLPSTDRRLWIVNPDSGKIILNTYVSHGKGSGYLFANHFSNRINSNETSIGVYLTKNQYFGHDGDSLRLKGLEKNFNGNAFRREIVIHGAPYVSQYFLSRRGMLGRSKGCPAVEKDQVHHIIDLTKNGSIIVAYSSNKNWLENSTFIHCDQ